MPRPQPGELADDDDKLGDPGSASRADGEEVLDETDLPQERDLAAFGEDGPDEEDTITCPNCRTLVWEDSPRCPTCGEWISPSAAPISGKAWIIIGLFVLAALVAALVFRL